MDYFTTEGARPDEGTLELIRQIAYSYRVAKGTDGALREMFLN